ncbi:hypothetical protein L596_003761 [Steinernema carpocapsae]|uniref:Uncharacterized protein n=1 Tax=Steinernema carpocapsae TaxID=34508 RepID=A0A4U8UXN3_STECR|nr:hypothetical protein L596_003761 [Steinernema carpocapsae]
MFRISHLCALDTFRFPVLIINNGVVVQKSVRESQPGWRRTARFRVRMSTVRAGGFSPDRRRAFDSLRHRRRAVTS